MKKLMIIVALAVCGAMAQAANINWSVNAIQSSPSVTVGAGWFVEVYLSTVTYDYAAAKAGTLDVWQSGTSYETGTTVKTFKASGTGTQDNGTTVSYYAVVYDAGTVAGAKNYRISKDVSVTTATAGADKPLSFGAMSGTTTANKFLGTEWKSVPEPTSAMLLLLGVAGLALKRKRA